MSGLLFLARALERFQVQWGMVVLYGGTLSNTSTCHKIPGAVPRNIYDEMFEPAVKPNVC